MTHFQWLSLFVKETTTYRTGRLDNDKMLKTATVLLAIIIDSNGLIAIGDNYMVPLTPHTKNSNYSFISITRLQS